MEVLFKDNSQYLCILGGQDSIANHPSMHLFNNEKCGPFELDNRIGFGNKTTLFQYPWYSQFKAVIYLI